MGKSVLGFFRTGTYTLWIPFLASVRYTDKSAPGTNDFLGLNYYSHWTVSVWNAIFEPEETRKMHPSKDGGVVMTDFNYPVYPEGFYSALHQLAECGKPIIVCENGIADAS